MRNVHGLFSLADKSSHPLYRKSELTSSENEALTRELIKLYDVSDFVSSDRCLDLVLEHPDYGYNLKLSVSIMETSENPDVYFRVSHIPKKSHLAFRYKTIEEVLSLDSGLHPLGIDFTDLDEDEDEIDLMEMFLKSIDCSNLFADDSVAFISDPKTKRSIHLSIELVNSADSYGLRIEYFGLEQ